MTVSMSKSLKEKWWRICGKGMEREICAHIQAGELGNSLEDNRGEEARS